MPDVILEAVGVGRTYAARGGWFARPPAPARPSLANASLQLRRGEILGIVGESGSGKTTLARCLALLERPDTGRVLFHGEDLCALAPAELRARRRRIQTVFQDPYASLNPRIRVGDALAEVLTVHRLAAPADVPRRVSDLLDLVGLPARAAAAYPNAFSGGQRQRVCIARALAAEPEVLIADEPVSSLDVSIQAQVVNLLLDLKDRLGLSVVFISHDLDLVDFMARRVLVMLGGEIVETLDADQPIAAARHPYTRALVEAVPRLDRFARADDPARGNPT